MTRMPTFTFPEEYERIHEGAWHARYQQARGELDKDAADQLVKAARIRRALARSQRARIGKSQAPNCDDDG